jgi:hypothetical protein
MRNSFWRALIGVFVASVAYAIWRVVQARVRTTAPALEWESAPFPFPPAPERAAPRASASPVSAPLGSAPQPVATPPPAEGGPWVEPVEGGCPATHPVKGKLSSGIFHVPGGQNYARTRPDRCYRDADAAEADGLRRSQR